MAFKERKTTEELSRIEESILRYLGLDDADVQSILGEGADTVPETSEYVEMTLTEKLENIVTRHVDHVLTENLVLENAQELHALSEAVVNVYRLTND